MSMNQAECAKKRRAAEKAAASARQPDPKKRPAAAAAEILSRDTLVAIGKHVYIMGQRFDAWENWTAE